MTNELKQFLQDWLDWAEDSAPADLIFYPNEGLCEAATRYSKVFGPDIRPELDQLLIDQHLHPRGYPFGGAERYRLDATNNEFHLNGMRLAWVRKQLKS